MKEFKINDFITLKLEEKRTNIYVKDKRFDQCKFLIFNIPLDEINQIDEIESIDEAAGVLRWRVDGQQGIKYAIDPETEFWGHCSNLQVWAENNYDTRLLHSNISFHLLKELVKVGDPLAIKVFTSEIVKRFISGYPTVVSYIINEKLLIYLNKEELGFLIRHPSFLDAFSKFTSIDAFSSFFDTIKEYELIDKYSFQIKTIFLSYLERLNPTNYPGTDQINYPYFQLLRIAREMGWIENYFSTFLKTMNYFSNQYRSNVFWRLIEVIEDSEVLSNFISDVETTYLNLINNMEKNSYVGKDFSVFKYIVKKSKERGSIDKQFLVFLEKINDFPQNYKCEVFSFLFNSIRDSNVIKQSYSQILVQKLNSLLNDINPKNFLLLTKTISNTEFIPELYSQFKAKFQYLLSHFEYDHFQHHSEGTDNITYLLEIAKIMGWRYEHFSTFLEFIKTKCHYSLFHTLLNAAIEVELVKKHFLVFLKAIVEIHFQYQFTAFSKLLSVKNKDELIDHNFLAILRTIDEYKKYQFASLQQLKALSYLISTTQNIELFDKYYSEIEALCLNLLQNITRNWLKRSFNYGLHSEHFPDLLNFFSNLLEKLSSYHKREAYSNFVNYIDAHLRTYIEGNYLRKYKIWKDKNALS